MHYRPIFNLFLISKVTELILKSRFSDHLTYNKLLNPHSISSRVQFKRLADDDTQL